MWFWLFMLVGLALAGLHLVGGSESGGTGDSTGMIILTILGLGMIVAGVVRVLLQVGGDVVRHAATWLVTFVIVAGLFSMREEIMALYERMNGQQVASVAMTQTGSETELMRAWDGHYRADVIINGKPLRLLVDTGASMVVLPYETVESVGIDPKKLNFSVPVTTANGTTTVAPIRLGSVSVGEIEVQNVTAAVAQPGRLKTGLLGMSFLDELDETVFQGDRLILRQNRMGALNTRFKQVPGAVNGMFPPEAQNQE